MSDPNQMDAIADDCFDVNKRIQTHGTETMKLLIRLLLFEIAQEIARQQASSRD